MQTHTRPDNIRKTGNFCYLLIVHELTSTPSPGTRSPSAIQVHSPSSSALALFATESRRGSASPVLSLRMEIIKSNDCFSKINDRLLIHGHYEEPGRIALKFPKTARSPAHECVLCPKMPKLSFNTRLGLN